MESFKPTNVKEDPLSAEECSVAVPALYNSKPFRAVNRRLHDPYKYGEPKFVLFSFIKSSGAVADKDGFLGVAKIRGSFHSEQDAKDRAEEIIRDVDSSNSIFTALTGVPFPLVDKGCAKELTEVDISKKVEKVISDNVRAKRQADEKELREIQERKAALVSEDGKINESEAPEDLYVQKRVKLAHLRYAIKEHISKAKECIKLEKTTRDDLNETKALNPEYESGFLKRYQDGRRKANIPESTDLTGFMKYLIDPINPENEDTYLEVIPSYVS